MGNCKVKLEQDESVNSVVLPSNKRLSEHKGGYVWYKKQFAKIGIMLGEPYKNNDIFSPAILPTGWKIIPGKHAMYSYLVDDLNRKRGNIFYHNKDCNMQLDCRFRITWVNYIYNNTIKNIEKYEDNTWVVVDYGLANDGCLILFSYKETNNGIAIEVCQNWLETNYPDYKDPTKYWDEE